MIVINAAAAIVFYPRGTKAGGAYRVPYQPRHEIAVYGKTVCTYRYAGSSTMSGGTPGDLWTCRCDRILSP